MTDLSTSAELRDDMRAELKTARSEITSLRARVAELEAALGRWQHYGCPDCGGDCSSANPPVVCCIVRQTYDALKGTEHE